MLTPNEEGCKDIILSEKSTHLQQLSKTIGKTLSSYTQAINIQNKTTGNLFQKKTKAKNLTSESMIMDNLTTTNYLLSCFDYIHYNPLKAGLVNDLRDWPYSSFMDYYGNRNGTLCNKALALQILSLPEDHLTNLGGTNLDERIIKKLF